MIQRASPQDNIVKKTEVGKKLSFSKSNIAIDITINSNDYYWTLARTSQLATVPS